MRFERPVPAGDYEEMLEQSRTEKADLLIDYLQKKPEPRLGGHPKETAEPDESAEAAIK